MTLFKSVRTSQPRFPADIDRSKSISAGMKVCIHHGFSNNYDIFGKSPVTVLSGGSVVSPRAPTPLGMATVFNSTSYNTVTEVPAWANITSEASALLVFSGQRPTAWELGATGQQDNFPFSNQLYTDAFWSSRWASAVSLPAGHSWDGLHIVVITVKNGVQRIYHNGTLWTSNTLSGGFTLPATLQLHKLSTTVHYGILDVLWERFLTDNEALSLSANPWQIFVPESSLVYVDSGSSGATSLTGSNAAQANQSTSGAISQTHILGGNNAGQSNASSSGSITQTHVLTGQNTTQANSSTSGAISDGSPIVLTGSDCTQASSSSSGAINLVIRRGGGIYWQDQPKRKIKRNWLDSIMDTMGVDDDDIKEFVEEHTEQPVIKKAIRKHISPVTEEIKWRSLKNDIAAMKKLLAEYEQYLLDQDDEDILEILMEMI